MFNNRLFVLLTLLAVSCGAQASQGLKIETQIERIGMIEYLPINMNITLINIGSDPISLPGKETEGVPAYYVDNLRFEVQGRQDLICFDQITATLYPSNPFPMFSIPPGGKHTFQVDIAERAGLLHPGTYQIRVIWDSSKIYKGWKGYAESEWVAITIEEAKGPDMGFLNAAKASYPKVSWQCLVMEGAIPKEVWVKYPSSIYTGWAMINQGRFEFQPQNSGHIPIDANLQASTNEHNQGLRKYGTQRIEELEAFLNLRPDFSLAQWMRFEIAFFSAYVGDFEKAGKVASLLIQDAPQTKGGMKAKELLTYLKEKKLIAEK
ncbi:hypothetical protein JT06_18580 [Desulfobulbus sp. Tol-SR]|jgi:hypothetical protein|nr:hypothetical protein JT06_18580 [Desulfobulbus sp. Tol-SR]